ncbi:hypothetical protein NL676_029899 [Syzygium grande]|nr:hypothetical protein NL676_029899 [Syzygium grande]
MFNPGLRIRAHVIRSDLDTNRFVENSLITLYFKPSSVIFVTWTVFDRLLGKLPSTLEAVIPAAPSPSPATELPSPSRWSMLDPAPSHHPRGRTKRVLPQLCRFPASQINVLSEEVCVSLPTILPLPPSSSSSTDRWPPIHLGFRRSSPPPRGAPAADHDQIWC